MAIIAFICYHSSLLSLTTLYIVLACCTIIHTFLCHLHSYNSTSTHLLSSVSSIHTVTLWRILNIIHFIHTVCLNWLYRIVSFMVISQYFINISCIHRQLQPNPLYCILAFIIWFIFIVCPCIHTVIYFHFTQWHCLYIISLTIILDNSHLQFVDV